MKVSVVIRNKSHLHVGTGHLSHPILQTSLSLCLSILSFLSFLVQIIDIRFRVDNRVWTNVHFATYLAAFEDSAARSWKAFIAYVAKRNKTDLFVTASNRANLKEDGHL